MELSETAKNSIRSYGKEENMEAMKQEGEMDGNLVESIVTQQ